MKLIKLEKEHLFPKYLYCFDCHNFVEFNKLEGPLIKCPECHRSSVHSCLWILHHHDECFWKLHERNVTIQAFSIYLTHCESCEHKFFCFTNRIENDWEYDLLRQKGWNVPDARGHFGGTQI